MNLPDAEYLEGCNFDPLPYFLIGGEIFPLKTWLMWPIPGKLSLAEQILNNRLSRARRVIENTFGILVARWRLYCTPIIVSIENAESYVLATLALHNYLTLQPTHQKGLLTQKIQLETLQQGNGIRMQTLMG